MSKIFGHTLVKIGKERRVSDIANRPIIDACILLYPNDLTRNKPCTKKTPKILEINTNRKKIHVENKKKIILRIVTAVLKTLEIMSI